MTAKIEAPQLERRALVYVRQSTARQVFEHGESTTRQYALADRATRLGWSSEQVEIIDEDLGHSGATADGRNGFTRLAKVVAQGKAGAIFALEVSRLARSSQDWQRLLALCAVARVLVIDEHTVYDPRDADDKLLLDLKGTMSEVELHWLRLRLTGARRSKAARGELRTPVATGYVWGDHGLEKDPDEAVRHAVQAVFSRFAIEPSAWSLVRWARETGFLIPTRRSFSEGGSELTWKALGTSRLCDMLRNPIYAGVYAYGRRPQEKRLVDGDIRNVRLHPEPEGWLVRIEDAHPGYITWETYLKNRKKLRDNVTRRESASRGAPREGPALLSGILLCGRCGHHMRAVYRSDTRKSWSYKCAADRDRKLKQCWSVTGPALDAAVEKLFLEMVVPDELELCLAVEREVESQAETLDQQWRLRLERAQYEARRAERRYKAVDPENRIVARTLEREWEAGLRDLDQVRGQYEDAKRTQRVQLNEEDRQRIRELSHDLPVVWSHPSTRPAERKAMLRLVIEAVSAHPVEVPVRETHIRVAWQSGEVTELSIPRPCRREWSRTSKETIDRVRELAAEGHHDEEIAERLNTEGLPKVTGDPWTLAAVMWVRRKNDIPRCAPDRPRVRPLPDRYPDGRYSIRGVMKRLDVSDTVIRGWIKRGLVEASRENYDGRQVYWITLDDEAVLRLQVAADRSKNRRKSRKPIRPEGGVAL